MKKIFILGLSVLLLTAAASAQTGPGDRFGHQRSAEGFKNDRVSRPERFQLHRDELRIKKERRNARRDGFVSHRERNRLHKMRRHERHERFHFRHHGRRRIQ